MWDWVDRWWLWYVYCFVDYRWWSAQHVIDNNLYQLFPTIASAFTIAINIIIVHHKHHHQQRRKASRDGIDLLLCFADCYVRLVKHRFCLPSSLESHHVSINIANRNIQYKDGSFIRDSCALAIDPHRLLKHKRGSCFRLSIDCRIYHHDVV